MLLTEEQIKEIETMAELFFNLDQIAVNAEIEAVVRLGIFAVVIAVTSFP